MPLFRRKNEETESPNARMIRRALLLLIVCGVLCFAALAVRLYYIQIVHHEEYESAAVSQQIRRTTVSARRGNIYDTNGNILAISEDVYNIVLSPAEVLRYEEDLSLIAARLSELLGIEEASIFSAAENTESWYEVLYYGADQETAEMVSDFLSEEGILSVTLENSSQRSYPYNELACHVIGFTGSENHGLSGVEYTYDTELSGTSGRQIRAVSAQGETLYFSSLNESYDASDGNDLILTLDTTIQYYLEKALEDAAERYDCSNGAAGIVMDVNTGAILGMASLEDYDLNHYLVLGEAARARVDSATDDSERSSLLAEEQNLMWRNKTVEDTYEPGSVFKIITLAMALEDGCTDLDDSFTCEGSIDVPGRTDPLWCANHSGHGTQTLTEAVMNSCNVAFVRLAQAIGAERFYDYADAFGFFDTTGIELPGESQGIWWDEDVFFEENNQSQLAAASFGQTFTVTPISLITAVSAAVNGGNLMRPYLVREIRDAEGETISCTEPQVIRQVISEETSALCREILEQVVGDENGTGHNAAVAGYRVGGKTGTSTKTTIEADTGEKEYIVSFLGFAPADDPEVAVLVLLDSPSSSCGVAVSGGEMAAPVVSEILADVLPYLGVEAQSDEISVGNS